MKKWKLSDEYLSRRQAAEELGVTPGYVSMLIYEGKLAAAKLDYVWVIRRADLEPFKKKEYAGGRKRISERGSSLEKRAS